MDYTTFIKIQICNDTNAFLGILRNIPVLGRFIPDRIFGLYKVKKWLSWGGILWDVLGSILKANLALVIFVYYIPRMIMKEGELGNGTYMGLFILLFVLGTVLGGSTLFKCTKEDFMFIHHFMVDPSKYYKYKAVRKIVFQGIFIAAGLAFVFRDVLTVVSVTALRMAAQLLTNVIYLEMFKRKNRIIHVRVREFASFASLFTAYALCFTKILNRITYNDLFLIVVFVVSTLTIVLSFVYHSRYELYEKMAIKYTDKGFVHISVGSSEEFNEGDNGLKSLKPEEGKAYFESNKHKSPLVYMDETFRKRYGKAIREPIISHFVFQVVILGILGFCIRTGWIPITADNVFEYSPIIISATLASSCADTFSYLYFRNMDCFFMKLKFYDRNSVKKLMTERFFRTLRWDGLILFFLVLEVLAFLLTSGIKLPFEGLLKMILVCPPILIISEVWDWLVYYLVQPYSRDITIKNPVMWIVGRLRGILELIFVFIRANITTQLPIILVITLAFVGVYFVMENYAYKFFKVRF